MWRFAGEVRASSPSPPPPSFVVVAVVGRSNPRPLHLPNPDSANKLFCWSNKHRGFVTSPTLIYQLISRHPLVAIDDRFHSPSSVACHCANSRLQIPLPPPLYPPLLRRAKEGGKDGEAAVRDRAHHALQLRPPLRLWPAPRLLPQDPRRPQAQQPQGLWPLPCSGLGPTDLPRSPLPSHGASLLLISSQGYAPICLGLEDFYTRRLYLRIQVTSIFRNYECFQRFVIIFKMRLPKRSFRFRQ